MGVHLLGGVSGQPEQAVRLAMRTLLPPMSGRAPEVAITLFAAPAASDHAATTLRAAEQSHKWVHQAGDRRPLLPLYAELVGPLLQDPLSSVPQVLIHDAHVGHVDRDQIIDRRRAWHPLAGRRISDLANPVLQRVLQYLDDGLNAPLLGEGTPSRVRSKAIFRGDFRLAVSRTMRLMIATSLGFLIFTPGFPGTSS
jgi:hypothetical protein